MNKINWTQVEVRAIVRLDSDEPSVLDVNRCYDCRQCISAYPFEAVTLAFALHHIEPPEAALQEIHRVLRPGEGTDWRLGAQGRAAPE